MPPKSAERIQPFPSAQGILDAVAAPIAVLDQSGERLSPPTRRGRTSAKPIKLVTARISASITLRCVHVRREAMLRARERLQPAFGEVLAGDGAFVLEYPCHSPDEQRWFQLGVRA